MTIHYRQQREAKEHDFIDYFQSFIDGYKSNEFSHWLDDEARLPLKASQEWLYLKELYWDWVQARDQHIWYAKKPEETSDV